MPHSTTFLVLATIALILQSLYFFLALFGPGLRYKVIKPPDNIESDEFIAVLEALGDAKVHVDSTVEVLTNGEQYYPAELESVKAAKKFIHLEAYIFQKGQVTKDFVDALTERAKAGVEVRVIIDAIGSFSTRKSYFKEMIEAGGKVCIYHELRWNNFFRFNNRTHRELLDHGRRSRLHRRIGMGRPLAA